MTHLSAISLFWYYNKNLWLNCEMWSTQWFNCEYTGKLALIIEFDCLNCCIFKTAILISFVGLINLINLCWLVATLPWSWGLLSTSKACSNELSFKINSLIWTFFPFDYRGALSSFNACPALTSILPKAVFERVVTRGLCA